MATSITRRYRPSFEQLETRDVPAASFVSLVPSSPALAGIPTLVNGQPGATILGQGIPGPSAAVGTLSVVLTPLNVSPGLTSGTNFPLLLNPSLLDSLLRQAGNLSALNTTPPPFFAIGAGNSAPFIDPTPAPDNGYLLFGNDATLREGYFSDLPQLMRNGPIPGEFGPQPLSGRLDLDAPALGDAPEASKIPTTYLPFAALDETTHPIEDGGGSSVAVSGDPWIMD